MLKAAVLFIWLGGGSNQTLALQRFNSLEECESARVLIAEQLEVQFDEPWKKSALLNTSFCVELK